MFVLHVLPVDIPRGAQVFARALVDAANRAGTDRHEIAVVFAGPVGVLRADHRLEVTPQRGRRFGFEPVAAWRLARLVRRLRPDVVVAHGGEPLKYLLLAPRDPRLVAHAIGVMPQAATRGVRRRLYRRLLSGSHVVVAVSETVAHQLRGPVGVPATLVRVIPNGRDVSAYAPRGADEPTPSPPRLVFVGHLTATKRPEVFVEVVRRLRERGRELEAVLVGDGPMADQLRVLAGPVGVELLGARTDVPQLLAGSSVFVFTSEVEGEGMPGVLIEAGLAGLPTVTTEVPGARDVVDDGVTGRVVPVDDVASLVDAVDELVVDPVRAASMGRAARRRCVEGFGLAGSVQAWLDVVGQPPAVLVRRDGTKAARPQQASTESPTAAPAQDRPDV